MGLTTAKKLVLFGRPGWVLPEAALDFDFANDRYWVGGGVRPSSFISLTRASSATNLLPTSASGYAYKTFAANILRITQDLGLLIEEPRTNLLLNSTVPATQTTVSLATGSYTLWVNGTGSAIASAGTATISGEAAATNGSPNTFTVTGAGTVTITVTGSLNAFQLEAGTFGTSLIVTAGSSAARAADVPKLIGPAAAAATSAHSLFAQTMGLNLNGQAYVYRQNAGGFIWFSSTTNSQIFPDAVHSANGALLSGTIAGTTKIAAGFDATSGTIIVNGGTKGTVAFAWTYDTPTYIGNNPTGTRALNGYMQRFALSLTKGAFDSRTA